MRSYGGFILDFSRVRYRKLGGYYLISLLDLFRSKIQISQIQIDEMKLNMIQYCGYSLLFSEGTSLIKRLKFKRDLYEPLLVTAINQEIKNKPGLFLDIGANIGLISLAILRSNPKVNIEAFEPGPHQNELFQKTIQYNNIGKNIRLYPFALGDRNETVSFCVHQQEDASGDGLLDTGRAGIGTQIQVTMRKLDDWWTELYKPEISVIKIDTEGAELLVLNGGREAIFLNKPIIFFELCEENIKPYSYSIIDIIIWFLNNDYLVYTLRGETVSINNYAQYLLEDDMFMAKPN